MSVKAWKETVTIPTYETGAADKNPMFFEKRVYQGSSGVVYPNPIVEKIYDEKIDKAYEGVFLENKYIKIMILPELGGRVQMAYDKIKERHFIYYNQVIKPALVGLCGPWISGGIEFNWPQHHRPSTYSPVEYTIQENEDGSKTIWVNEVEKMFHTKGMAGFTLHPDKAYLEIKAKLSNPTDTPQTFLWWANPAVRVHDDYQSVFPPDVNAVFDHGKRDVSDFPIATGTYYKVDYSPGTDISRYKNIPVPTSYMAINSQYNFVGGYEHDIEAGMLHVADHHVSPGKKQWTWGNGDFGLAWDKNLTDEDGPYIELMAGVFTDNQPDFTWLKPFEEKTFTQYFLPYRELGVVKNASQDIMLSADLLDNRLEVKIFASSAQQLHLKVQQNGVFFYEEALNLNPEAVYIRELDTTPGSAGGDFSFQICDAQAKVVLAYDPKDNDRGEELPEAAKPALLPSEIDSVEQLFLTAQHLEQYRHATYRPMPYYEEGIKREPADIRCNNAIGLWKLRKGLFKESLPYFQTAVDAITSRNPNPYNCEPYFNLGLAYLYLNKTDKAYDAFFKAAWDKSFQDAAYFHIAQIDLNRNHYERCLEHIDAALDRNARNGKAYVIKAICLEKLDRTAKATQTINQGLERDLFNLSLLFERYRSFSKSGDQHKAEEAKTALLNLSGAKAHNAIEYAIDYIQLGLYSRAIEFLQLTAASEMQDPLLNYYLGYAQQQLGNNEDALAFYQIAAKADSSYCFPNRLFDILVLQEAGKHNPEDAKALYYLGNLFYDKQQYELAIGYWESSAAIDPSFATVHRNLGLAYYNKRKDPAAALTAYEKAFHLNKLDARVIMELDSLYKKLNKSAAFRLQFLTDNQHAVQERDDLYLEMVSLQNFLSNYEEAYDFLMARKFHPWEGGEGKVSEQYKISLIEMAKKDLLQGDAAKAIHNLEAAQVYPDNLGEGKLVGVQENDIFYWLGNSHEALGDTVKAQTYWSKATEGISEPGMAMFYNDQQPDKIFYQGCAWLKLNERAHAKTIFSKLAHYGEQHRQDEVKLDYFAVSLPDLLIFESNLSQSNIIHCLYLSALGYLGLGERAKSNALFEELLYTDASHQGAKIHLQLISLEDDLLVREK
jgi:tetratricopeptide (TPR) repeat protein